MPGQLLAVPYTAVQFVALQQCRSFAKRNGLLEGDRAWLLSFVNGAAAGAAATVASYPFDTLRTILAAQGKPPVSICRPSTHVISACSESRQGGVAMHARLYKPRMIWHVSRLA